MFFCDFHTHSIASDGELSRVELIRRASLNGCSAVAITDHVGVGDLESNIEANIKDCELAAMHWGIIAIPGVELTHMPVEEIDNLAKKAKSLGAKFVVVHGETLVEPVIKGTNEAAASSKFVDLLSHPGMIDENTANIAAANNIFLELSLRKGHCIANGHIAKIAQKTNVKLIVSTDAHKPEELLTEQSAINAVLGAGLEDGNILQIVEQNSKDLLEKLGYKKL